MYSKVIHLYVYMLFFRFCSIIGYYKILNIFLCAILLFLYFIDGSSLYMIKPNS